MKTKAAVVFERSGKFSIEQLEISEPNDDEVLVRIAATGICHTDLAGREQYLPIPPTRAFPAVFGHEGAGVVEKVGARVTKVKPGDHVALSWNSCGACPSCKSGNEPYCDNLFLYNFNGARPDGTTTLRKGDQVIYGSFFCQSSFANFALANERNIVKVRKDVPLEILGPLGCGIRTGAGAVMNTLRPSPGASIAIFGVGPVGMSALLASVVCGCTTIIAVDVIPERLEKAKEFGATHTINAKEVDPVAGDPGHHRRGSGIQPGVCRQSQGSSAGCGRLAPPRGLRTSRGCAAGHRGRPGYGPDHERPHGSRDPCRRFHFGSVHSQTS